MGCGSSSSSRFVYTSSLVLSGSDIDCKATGDQEWREECEEEATSTDLERSAKGRTVNDDPPQVELKRETTNMSQRGAPEGAERCNNDLVSKKVSVEALACASCSGGVTFLPDISLQDPQVHPRVAELVRQAFELAAVLFNEHLLEVPTDWKLALLASKCLSVLCGFIVYKVVSGHLSVSKLAVPLKFRGLGFGRLLMEKAIATARKRSDIYEVNLSSLPTATGFYQRLGFKALEVGGVNGQVYMVKKLNDDRNRSRATLPPGMDRC
eukprot:gnl/TRDRNA2_/TRDRNA2_202621_c0_seq1.p1 gnl/TRDRNA2_/TRDRNA2_202621_c0~~gnl/TRDRNA2_/TRDRNA2_202621_c0_seq1.p1  ORF type:complete len:267 (-),score=39.97 gnl/TRDRNA2_/TRDRNA2_202621_c0_seq1:38-838(-)